MPEVGGGAPVSIPPSTSSTPASGTSEFDTLWNAAQSRGKEEPFHAIFSLYMRKDDYCDTYRCGDEFTRDKEWQAARAGAEAVKQGTWREEVPLAKGLFLSSDHLGEFDQKRNTIPILFTWPHEFSGTDCAPTRPIVERVGAPGWGNAPVAGALWKESGETLFAVPFESPEQARSWKEAEHKGLALRFVFKLTGAAVHPDAGALAIIRVLGVQLREDGAVYAERVGSGAARPRAPNAKDRK